MVRHEYEEMLAVLSDVMAGKLFKALMHFSITGETPKIPRGLNIIYPAMRNVIIRDQETYAETCERNRQYALKRWHKDDASPPTENAEPCHSMPENTEPCHPNPNPNPNPNPKPNPNPNPNLNPNPNPEPSPMPNPMPNPEPHGGSASAQNTPAEFSEEIPPSKEPFTENICDEKGSFEPIKTHEIEYDFYGMERNVKLSKGEYAVLSANYPNETRHHIDLLSKTLKKGKTIEGSHFDYIRGRIEAEARMKRNVRFD